MTVELLSLRTSGKIGMTVIAVLRAKVGEATARREVCSPVSGFLACFRRVPATVNYLKEGTTE